VADGSWDGVPLETSDVGLLEGIATTRAIRRYRDEPVPESVLRTVLFAASRAPTGSNRPLARFVVLRDGPRSQEARALLAGSAERAWAHKRARDGFAEAVDTATAKGRMAVAMDRFVAEFGRAPVILLPCLLRHNQPDGLAMASLYPAVQNLLLAARALGYGGVITMWHIAVEAELRALLGIPDDVAIGGTLTLGRPEGGHGPVRRRPMGELVYEDAWGLPAPWAVDPPSTTFAGVGPPRFPDGPPPQRA
jgi:nitroreductase